MTLNACSSAITVGRFVLSLDIPALQAGRAFMAHGCGSLLGDGIWRLTDGPEGIESPVSNFVTLLGSCGTSPCFLFGIDGKYEAPSYFKVEAGNFLAGFKISGILQDEHNYGLVFSSGACPSALLNGYGDFLKNISDMSRPVDKIPTGWNSWGLLWWRGLHERTPEGNVSHKKNHTLESV